MVTFECPRCSVEVPKSGTKRNKIWGRICNSCYREIGELRESFRSGMPKQSKTIAPKTVEKRAGLFSRIAQKLFRRRGVR